MESTFCCCHMFQASPSLVCAPRSSTCARANHDSLKVSRVRGHSGSTLRVLPPWATPQERLASLKHPVLKGLWSTSLASLLAATACSSNDSSPGGGAGTGGARQTGGSGGATATG